MKPKRFYTLKFVIDSRDVSSAEEIKCKMLKYLESEGVYVYETETKDDWLALKVKTK